MEQLLLNSKLILEYGATGIVFIAFLWAFRFLLCNNKKLAESLKEITQNYSNHITQNTTALHDLKNEITGQKDILKDIRDEPRK